ncbi:MAG TPA: hypothetical protein PKD68_04545, partial [Candidatus Saccharibacteria bacterium]|nr:hypothetical protein [Candidatus Saccharibacteria bacterium]
PPPPPPPPPTWTITGVRTVETATKGPSDKVTAAPGEKVTFKHYVKNNGPDTSEVIWSDSEVTGGLGVVEYGQNNGTLTNGQERETKPDTITIPSNALNGQQYCQRVRYAPSAHNDTSLTGGPWACVTVSYTYALTPVVAPSDQSVAIGSSVSFGTSVRMNSTYYSNSTDWTIRKIVIPPTASNNFFGPGAISMSDRILGQLYVEPFTCYFYTFRGATCADVATNSQQFNGTTTTPVGSGTYTETMNYPIGTRVCYAVMVNSYNRDAGQYRETASCAIVAKYPALEVQQGMVRVGGAFANASGVCQLTTPASQSGILMHNYQNHSRGSRGLAALAVGNIQYFGSHNNYYSIQNNPLSRSLLFAAADTLWTNPGLFLGNNPTTTFCLPSTASLYTNRAGGGALSVGSAATRTVSLATASTATYNFTGSNATLLLSGDRTLNPGEQVVIRVNNTNNGTGNAVQITGNIRYSAAPIKLAGGERVPQFVLLADGDTTIQPTPTTKQPIAVRIADTVTELNGTYSTKGNIYTCFASGVAYDGAIANPLTNATCNQSLTIKGALIAKQILPYRTAGYDDVNNTTPAETFRLTPEALIGDYQYGQDNPILRTVRQRELPVRL